MKKIIPILVIGAVILCGIGAGGSFLEETNIKQAKFADEYEVFDDEKDVTSIFGLKGPIINKLFHHMDIISFSIYEDVDTPEYLYMKMNIGEVKYTEFRSLYNIIWDFNGLMYCTGMHTLNKSETILDYSAYYESDGTEHKIWSTSVEIDEENGVFTWTIIKDDLGLNAGDKLEKPWAHSVFMTKKWNSIFHIRFAQDMTESGPDYLIKY